MPALNQAAVDAAIRVKLFLEAFDELHGSPTSTIYHIQDGTPGGHRMTVADLRTMCDEILPTSTRRPELAAPLFGGPGIVLACGGPSQPDATGPAEAAQEPSEPPGNFGWGYPTSTARKAHYGDETGRSLCGKYLFLDRDMCEDGESAFTAGPDDCAECRRRFVAAYGERPG
jgi:hypothetical protein